jgi:phosphatidylinositol alpha-1,6-mannosyltransferase
MERLAFEVTSRLAARRTVEIVPMRPRPWALPLFMFTSALRIAVASARGELALLHIGDPVLAPLAVVARLFSIPTSVTLHGLDVIYAGVGYPPLRRLFLRRFDRYICISEATRRAAIEHGVPAERITVIGIGVDVPVVAADPVPRDMNCVLFVGRLVRRKGLEWFVSDVMPALASRFPQLKMVVLGDGPERARIAGAAAAAGIEQRIVWLGSQDDDAKMHWMARAAVCVMPNIAVPNDMEGFGIVALEAAAAGCPVVASDIEGLQDAVSDGESGSLVPPENARAWLGAIDALLADAVVNRRTGERAQAHVRAHRGWGPIVDAYDRVLSDVSREPPHCAR